MNPPVIHPKPGSNGFQEVDYDPYEHRLVYIHVAAEDRDPMSMHLEDWDALGLWGVIVPLALGPSQATNCALDAFHSTVPIKWLSSVTWKVWDAMSGQRMERDPSVEWYTMQEQAALVCFVAHMG